MFFFGHDISLDDFRQQLGARIATAVERSETKAKAAEAAGVSVEQLNKWIKGTVKVPVDALRALSAFVDVDFCWLVSGEGSAPPRASHRVQREYRRTPESEWNEEDFENIEWVTSGPSKPVSDEPLTKHRNESTLVSIPLYKDVRPSAGPGNPAVSETLTTRVAFESRWLADLGVRASSAVILPAQGDSMEPTIKNGTPMLIDTSKTEIQSGFIYVIAVEGDLLVKRVRRRLDGKIELISDNAAYGPETLDPASVRNLRVIGRVYASVTSF